MANNDPEVFIAGAGPTGLLMAIEMARRGRKLRIVEQNASPSIHSKALGMQARTLEVFEALGFADKFVARGEPTRDVRIYSGVREIAHVHFDETATRFPYVLVIPQSATEQLLAEQLSSLGVEIERETRLTDFEQDDAGVSVAIARADGASETLRAGWLIGCDGAHSTTRHVLGTPFEGVQDPEDFGLVDCRLDGLEHGDSLQLHPEVDGLTAIFPMGGARRRIVATLAPGVQIETMDAAAWQDLLARRGLPHAAVSDITWQSAFHVSYRAVESMRSGRVFLAGDAAHIHSPAGGQGMNTGLQDAHNLAWKLDFALSGLAPDSLLDTYSVERHQVAKDVLRLTRTLTSGATTRSVAVRLLRNTVLSLLSHLPAVQNEITGDISEIKLSYRQSPLNGGSSGRVAPGERAPDIAVMPADSQPHRLFDIVSCGALTLLCVGQDSDDKLRAAQAASSRKYGRLVNAVIASDADAVDAYGAGAPQLLAVRPDGYVGFRGDLGDVDALDSYLRSRFTIEPDREEDQSAS